MIASAICCKLARVYFFFTATKLLKLVRRVQFVVLKFTFLEIRRLTCFVIHSKSSFQNSAARKCYLYRNLGSVRKKRSFIIVHCNVR